VLHYAANRVALCRKTRCIMPQNALYYAAKCGPILPQNVGLFCRKMWACFAAKIVPSYFCIITKNKKKTEKFV